MAGHSVIQYGGSQNINGVRVYVDGAAGSVPGSGVITNTLLTTKNAQFGRRNTSFYFSENMDELAWWDKSLSQAKVTELYNGGLPKTRIYALRLQRPPITRSFKNFLTAISLR